MVERGVLGENERFVDGEAVEISQLRHDFGLFDRINAEFTLEVLIQFDEIFRIAGVFDNHRNHLGFNIQIRVELLDDLNGGWCDGFHHGFNSRWCCSLSLTEIDNHVIERGVLGENEGFVDGEAVEISQFRHDLGLFDRVNAEFTLEVLIQFNEVGWVARVFDDDRDDLCCNIAGRGGYHRDGCCFDDGWGCRFGGGLGCGRFDRR